MRTVLAILLLGEVLANASTALSPNSLLTKDDVVELIKERWWGVSRWEAEYEARSVKKDDPEKGVQIRLAVAAPDLLTYDLRHFTEEIPARDDRYGLTIFYKKGVSYQIYPQNRSYTERKRESGEFIGGSIWRDVIVGLIPVWPLREYKLEIDEHTGAAVPLLECIASAAYVLKADREEVNGELCYVFENRGKEVLWISVDKTGALVKRERYSAHSGALVEVFTAEKITQPTRVHWVPTKGRTTVYGYKGSDRFVAKDVLVTIRNFRVNAEVVPSIFTPTMLPGMLRSEMDGTEKQVIPGGTDLLLAQAVFLTTYVKKSKWTGAMWWLLPILAYSAGLFLYTINTYERRK